MEGEVAGREALAVWLFSYFRFCAAHQSHQLPVNDHVQQRCADRLHISVQGNRGGRKRQDAGTGSIPACGRQHSDPYSRGAMASVANLERRIE